MTRLLGTLLLSAGIFCGAVSALVAEDAKSEKTPPAKSDAKTAEAKPDEKLAADDKDKDWKQDLQPKELETLKKLEQVRELRKKAQEGKAIQPQEKQLLLAIKDQLRNRMAQLQQNLIIFAPPQGIQVNVVDVAAIDIAKIYYQKKRYDLVLETLQGVVRDSLDENARNFARLLIGHMYRVHYGAPDKAIEQYLAMEGKLSSQSLSSLLDTYEEVDDLTRLKTLLDARVKTTKAWQEKVDLLRRMATVYQLHDQEDAAIETLRRIPSVLAPEQLTAYREQKIPGQPDKDNRPNLGEEIKDTKSKIAAMEKEGRLDEAERLKLRLELLENRQKAGKVQDNPGDTPMKETPEVKSEEKKSEAAKSEKSETKK